jgi:uncharacterized protein (DUF1684 family)
MWRSQCTHRLRACASTFAAALILGCIENPAAVEDLAAYEQSIADWHASREERLLGPDGWLNLAGLYWLVEGSNSFGSAASNDIVLPQGRAPERVGEFVLRDGRVSMQVRSGVTVLHEGSPVKQLDLTHDGAGEPTLLTHGSLAWFAIKRMDRMGLRVRDYEHPALRAFPGIDTYPVVPDWRVSARLEPYPEPRRVSVRTVVEGLGWDPVAPGVLAFEINGDPLSLEAFEAGDDLFILFADLTSGTETYPGGRYLYARRPGPDGLTVLDFNKAYNPPCAFNEFATCPLPSRRNRLPVMISAGEKYSDALHAGL